MITSIIPARLECSKEYAEEHMQMSSHVLLCLVFSSSKKPISNHMKIVCYSGMGIFLGSEEFLGNPLNGAKIWMYKLIELFVRFPHNFEFLFYDQYYAFYSHFSECTWGLYPVLERLPRKFLGICSHACYTTMELTKRCSCWVVETWFLMFHFVHLQNDPALPRPQEAPWGVPRGDRCPGARIRHPGSAGAACWAWGAGS